jgi:glycosyltransferase involved in cell wall biosynthesis
VNSLSKQKANIEAIEKIEYCVVIPTYNNAKHLEKLLLDVLEYSEDVIVVNDGCTDHTPEILTKFNTLQVITLPDNKGKGEALRTGFKYALGKGYNYAITIDSDGQHFAKDIPAFLKVLNSETDVIVIGSRQLKQENVPGKNSLANRISNFWFRIETGLKLPDTQSGYRLYPIRALQGIKTFSGKYEFELEIIVKAVWKGTKIKMVPIDVYYPPKGERTTHFRPFTDFMRISLLNTLLVPLGLLYYRPRLLFNKYRKKSLKQILKEDIIKSDTPRYNIALSIAFGVFMGIFPVWGYQLAIGFFLAHLFKLNKAIFFIAANISLPPMIPFILYLSYVAGSYALSDGSWVVNVELNLESITMNLKQYLVGAVVFATIAGILTGAVSYLLLVLFKRAK